MDYTYLLINIGTILITLALSFDRKVHFYTYRRQFVPAIIITAAVFIVWDLWFTSIDVWYFNSTNLTGLKILNLPVEDWLFLITVPYASIYIYELLTAYIHREFPIIYGKIITLTLLALLLPLLIIYSDRLYTVITFSLSSSLLILHLIAFRASWLGMFYLLYLVILIPFLIVNGILASLAVVLYNDNENMGIRIFSTPVEDIAYMLLLLLMNITIYEYLKLRTYRK